MCTYVIYSIQPKCGRKNITHSNILGRHCQILRLEIGRRGWLLVDVGDTEHGPHRIALSVVRQVRGTDGDENVYIETEFTIYQLRKIRAE
jgi:hypothetical protein